MIHTHLKFPNSPIAVICHDAGAANLIIGWLRNATELDLRAHMQGPALDLWMEAFPNSRLLSLGKALEGSAQLLSGSGWASLLEHEGRLLARELGIPVVAVVDHWVNYRERFVRAGLEVLPEEIWLADEYAYAEAANCFPNVTLRQLPNLYLQTQVDAINKLDLCRMPGEVERVLYAMEPIRMPWVGEDTRNGEFQALDYFLGRLQSLGLSAYTQIRLRPHPSDTLGKYDSWIESRRTEFVVAMAPSEPLAQTVSWADWVVGCESYVLVIAIAAGKNTVSTLPPWGNACRLPQKELVHLSLLP